MESANNFGLEGKVTIVTAGASGIGAEAARTRLVTITATLEMRNKSRKAVAFAVEKYGALDIMFSNAGVLGNRACILEIAVNLRGAAACIKHAACVMVERKTHGSIISTASVASMVSSGPRLARVMVTPHPSMVSWVLSERRVVSLLFMGLVRTACGELVVYGIRVNLISPYLTATATSCKELGMEASELENAVSIAANLKGIIFKPIHVAQTALFLASDQSAYVSGHNLVVDGGFLARR
ncbi:hypothetical protein PIB30_025667 [Stylosanthes scabra]|uniref:Uncharacterized protein n=1 Tax=Stylosanthes scabra TaxID=79078 RepID=A0ABU6W839_9FABA|nr:hypothetical protein [Stylosanthes scabra]